MNLLAVLMRIAHRAGEFVDWFRNRPQVRPCDCGPRADLRGSSTEVAHTLNSARCHLLLTETGLTIRGWPSRIAFVALGLATTGLFLVAAGVPVAEFSVGQRIASAAASGLSYLLMLGLSVRSMEVTETSSRSFWSFVARHANRWLQLAMSRFFTGLVALVGALFAAVSATQPDASNFEQALWSNVSASLGLVSGAALLAALYEYPRQMRALRRASEPTILSLELGHEVDPREVSQLLLALARGVASPRNGSIGLIEESRARVGIAIYHRTRSPSSIAPLVHESAVRLGIKRKRSEPLYKRLANRTSEAGGPIERNAVNSLAGHPRATPATWGLMFDWINVGAESPAPLKAMHESWSRPQR